MKNADIKAVLDECTEERKAAIKPLLCGQGFCTAKPAVTIAGKKLCFTGRSARASREAIAQTVSALGGTFQPHVTRETDYLVVCSEGSPGWAYTTYGSKICRAAHIKSEGGRPCIVCEEDFWAACEDGGIKGCLSLDSSGHLCSCQSTQAPLRR